MKRIAIWLHGGVGGGFFSQGQPAIQHLVERLATHFEVDVFSVLPPNVDFRPAGYKLYYVKYRGVPRLFRYGYLLALFARHHLARRYRLVYAFWGYPAGAVAVLLGRLIRIPSVIHLQGGDAVSLTELKYGVFYKSMRGSFCRWIYNQSTCLVALTDFQASCLRDNGVRKEAFVIPYGTNVDRFAFRPGRPQREGLRFLHVGNLTPVKGQEIMLRAFLEIVRQRPARLTIVGGDFCDGHLKRLCASMKIESCVEFLSPQPHSSMPAFYWEADILLHTSWYEGQGLVIAEAAACGTIVAGTAVGMLADMGEACAVIVAPGEAQQLADKILTLVASPAKVVEMQHNARRWVEKKDVNYTERKIVGTLNAVLHATSSASKAPSFKG